MARCHFPILFVCTSVHLGCQVLAQEGQQPRLSPSPALREQNFILLQYYSLLSGQNMSRPQCYLGIKPVCLTCYCLDNSILVRLSFKYTSPIQIVSFIWLIMILPQPMQEAFFINTGLFICHSVSVLVTNLTEKHINTFL